MKTLILLGWSISALCLAALVIPSMGFGAFYLLFVAFSFGYNEFFLTRHWKKEKRRLHQQGTPVEEMKEEKGLMIRFGVSFLLPMFAYSLGLYFWWRLGVEPERLKEYMELNRPFQDLTAAFIPTIETHYNAAAEGELVRAKVQAHLNAYALINLFLFPIVMIPVYPAWTSQLRNYEFSKEIKADIKVVIAMSVLSFFAVMVSLWELDAPAHYDAPRLHIDVLANNIFLLWLTLHAPVLSWVYYLIASRSFCAVSYLFERISKVDEQLENN